jgi:hypothetical protein
MSQQKEEFHNTILREDLTRVDEEDSTRSRTDLVEEEEDQSFVIIEINQDIWRETS